jgi:uncharacterized protein
MMLRYASALLLSVFLLGACTTTPNSRYYLLDPLAVAPIEKTADSDKRLGIGTISLPDYLNRKQVVIRGAGGRLLIRDGERWGEPLEDSVRRVLGENLGRLLGPGRLVFLPAPAGIAVHNRLHLEITAFEASAHHEVQLSARWSLSQTTGTSRLHESHIRVAMQAEDQSAMVTAMNQALLQLANEIATENRAF